MKQRIVLPSGECQESKGKHSGRKPEPHQEMACKACAYEHKVDGDISKERLHKKKRSWKAKVLQSMCNGESS